jgi:hypothetical protein
MPEIADKQPATQQMGAYPLFRPHLLIDGGAWDDYTAHETHQKEEEISI